MSLLPYDILFFILIRLPAKSLLRFRSVSKLWNAIIFDKKFKKAHCDQSKALGRLKFLLRKRVSTYTPSSAADSSLWILRPTRIFEESNTYRLPFFQWSNNISYANVDKEIEFVELKNPQVVTEKQQFPLTGSQISILCSHDGLLLLCTYNANDKFVLWNPSTRQDKKFVCPYVIIPCVVPNACGLCYDSITDDYKFILIFKSFYVVCSANNNLWMMRNTLPILEKNLVETIDSSWSNLFSDGITEGISTNEGCIYWSLDCPLYTSRRKLLVQQVSKNSRIICFDAKSSYKLKELPAPDFVGEGELFCLSTLRGRLILNGGKLKDHESNIWIKEDDGWKWLVKIRRLPAYIEQTKLLHCTEDGEFIFLGPMKDHVSISDPKRQTYDVQSYKPDHSEYVNALVDPVCLDSLCFPRLN